MARVLPFLALALVAPVAIAHHDTSWGACDPEYGGLGIVHVMPWPVNDGHAESQFYVDDRNYAFGNGIWIYQETNGVYTGGLEGLLHPTLDLQRGGSSPYVPDDTDICAEVGPWEPDRLIL